MKKNAKKVYVGLSGGVDSSVSAALLKSKGFDVTGVFIKGWYPEWQECDWKADRRDAMRVCASLNIPFITLDLEKEYKREVVDYMIHEYKHGRTPNPDVMCNKEIKFGLFLKFALSKGAKYVATGHYAQVSYQGSKYFLKKGADSTKDQSYFLWTLTQDQLKHVLFPVGRIKKTQVRKLAQKFNLPTATKKDSQGLCFIGKVDMTDFLSHYVKSRKGKVLDTEGKVIGAHTGAVFLTIGQRHGFTVKNKADKSYPYYVISKNLRKNTVTVARRAAQKEIVGKREITLKNTNWIPTQPSTDKTYDVRLRYRQQLIKAKIKIKGKKCSILLDFDTSDISQGQSLVVYEKEKCIGGGVIV